MKLHEVLIAFFIMIPVLAIGDYALTGELARGIMENYCITHTMTVNHFIGASFLECMMFLGGITLGLSWRLKYET